MTATRTSAMAERVAELESKDNHAKTFRHADGSVTVVMYQTDTYDYDSPRDYDGNVATLIMESSDYYPLDSDDAGLSEARDRWDIGHARYEIRVYSIWSSNRSVTVTYDRETMMQRYVAMFRPDIALYVDSWSVSGYSQSDWAGGWGYVTRAAFDTAFPETSTHHAYLAANTVDDEWIRATPESAFNVELSLYEQHFRGDYYYAVHLEPTDPELVSTIVDYGSEPVETYGDDYREDVCHGFLGYDNLADIAGNFTSSEVVQ